jgi:hypothetical protein
MRMPMPEPKSDNKPKEDTVIVGASDLLFERLGNNQLNFLDLLSELIDNSIAGAHDDKPVRIRISFFSGKQGRIERIRIRDNGRGIPEKHLGKALSLGAKRIVGSLNEHGMGMKQAVMGLGMLDRLLTRVDGSDRAVGVDRFGFGEIPLVRRQVTWTGTEITIKDLKHGVVPDKYSVIRSSVCLWIGARYRKFLIDDPASGASKRAEIQLRHYVSGEERRVDRIRIQEVNPAYRSDIKKEKGRPEQTRFFCSHMNDPLDPPFEECRPEHGCDWKFKLVIGLAPEGSLTAILGRTSKQARRNQPYHVSQKNQGLDVIMNDRVIVFSQWSELFQSLSDSILVEKHPSFNRIRGELILGHGFSTTITKNQISLTTEWRDARERLYHYVKEQRLFNPPPPGRREAVNNNLLIEYLKNKYGDHFEPKQVAGIFDAEIDIKDTKNNEAYELKVVRTTWQDVFQLFGYMSASDMQKGYLVAYSHKQAAKDAVKHINEKYPLEIQLKHFDSDYKIK